MAKVLVVDDEQSLVMALQAILGTAGHEVLAMVSGEEALDSIEANPPDIVIADVVMPGMDGLALEQAVRSRPELAGIPFLFLSANTAQDLEARIATLDNTRFLHKPFEVEDLFDVVSELLDA